MNLVTPPRSLIGFRTAGRLSGMLGWARLARGFRFGLVGLLGLAVNQFVLWLLVSAFGLNYLIAAVVASQASTAAAFVINETWVFRAQPVSRSFRSLLRRFLVFDALNAVSLLLRLPVLYVLTSVVGVNYLLSNLAAIAIFMLMRFVVADGWIWRASTASGEPAPVFDGLHGREQ
ncbi:MAG TPA: GtrA family protein [Candidatus Micrarchaeaceae archaeon]|nr:GtrA family protein [Candidatus Micrarchaeaceae archaeon]